MPSTAAVLLVAEIAAAYSGFVIEAGSLEVADTVDAVGSSLIAGSVCTGLESSSSHPLRKTAGELLA